MYFQKTFVGLWLLFFAFLAKPASANNIFGIHILEPSEAEKASKLVNSSGGDWGYAAIVLREDDLNYEKWQKFMDDCRRLHLIPIVRIAAKMEGNYWTKPNVDDLQKWPKFLNSLNWPIKDQIVVIFNEPNHSKEWGGEINPSEYALVLSRLAEFFKKENNNFFILNAGLDQAADGSSGTMREEEFLRQMWQLDNDIFNKLDGWASHSYPNHGFVGLPSDTGRASIKGYEWELEQLKRLSLIKDLPIFITETGWPHKEGEEVEPRFYQDIKVAQFMENAFDIWTEDSRIKSVNPFVLNYPQAPFDHFSWIKKDGQVYEQFNQVLGMKKTSDWPKQVEDYQILAVEMADILPTNYIYKGKVKIKNTGQWIMGERQEQRVKIKEQKAESKDGLSVSELVLKKGSLVHPGQEIYLDFEINTGTRSGEYQLAFGDEENNKHTIYIYKPFEWNNKKISLLRQIGNRLKLWWMTVRE